MRRERIPRPAVGGTAGSFNTFGAGWRLRSVTHSAGPDMGS